MKKVFTTNLPFEFLFVYSALALSAAAALIYEVVASDVLLNFFIESTFSISTVLSVFLFGLAIGSLLYNRFQNNIKNKLYLFGILQVTIALYGYFVFSHIVTIVPPIQALGLFMVSALILFIPTVALGVIFPLAISLVQDEKKASFVYFVDLIGAVGGSLFAGFYLIPELGNVYAIYIAAFMSLAAAFFVFKTKGRIVVTVLFILFLFLLPQQEQLAVSEQGDVSFHKTSPFGEVVLEDQVLYIDGRDQCAWTYSENTTERQIVNRVFENIRQPDAKILNIGLGCGLTLEKILEHTTSSVDIVEINPVVVEANRLMSSLLTSSRINLVLNEGIAYLKETQKRYDAIIVDIENPAVVHSSDLYTLESFDEIHNSLVEGGVFGLWVNRCDNGEYNDIIFNTLSRVFKNVYEINENIFIASDKALPYTEYISFTDTKAINTLNRKRISKIFFDSCRFGEDSTQYITF